MYLINHEYIAKKIKASGLTLEKLAAKSREVCGDGKGTTGMSFNRCKLGHNVNVHTLMKVLATLGISPRCKSLYIESTPEGE